MLALIHLDEGQKLRISKRDARCCFDQLRLPEALMPWMGRPPVSIAELLKQGGMTRKEVGTALLFGSSGLTATRVFPVSAVWPMGFSWSSFVAQSTMMGICEDAGLDESGILSADRDTPSDFSLVHAVATDDVMLFSTHGPGRTSEAAAHVDEAMARAGMEKHAAKDVNDELEGMCVGLALENGTHWSAPPQRCLGLLLLVLKVVAEGVSSPARVHHILGTMQWYDLICRPKLSVYERIYSFTGNRHDDTLQIVPADVLGELLHSIVLSVYWSIDLRRPFLPLAGCSDASGTFGFGASVLRTSLDTVRNLAWITGRADSFVVLDHGASASDYAERVGEMHCIGLRKADFVHVFSIKKKHDDHINVLEGEALVILIRWILRSRARHGTRLAIIVDSKVLAGAASKGRSSSRLNRVLRRLAALELAGDLMLMLAVAPSNENPSDVPSRGEWRKKHPATTAQRRHKVAQTERGVELNNCIHSPYAAEALALCGFDWSDLPSSFRQSPYARELRLGLGLEA